MKKLVLAMLILAFGFLSGCASMGDMVGTAATDQSVFPSEGDPTDD